MSSVKEDLKRAALHLFTKKGYAGTSVREIVEEAKTTKPCLYYYFKNKEGIYLAILKDAMDDFLKLLKKKYKKNLKPSDEIKRLCFLLFKKMKEKKEVVRLIHSYFYAPEQGTPHFNFENFHKLFFDTLKDKVKKAVEEKEFQDRDREAMAFCFMALWNTLAEMRIVFPKKYNYEKFLERILNVAIDSFKRRNK